MIQYLWKGNKRLFIINTLLTLAVSFALLRIPKELGYAVDEFLRVDAPE